MQRELLKQWFKENGILLFLLAVLIGALVAIGIKEIQILNQGVGYVY